MNRRSRTRKKPANRNQPKTQQQQLGFVAKALRGLGSLGGATLGGTIGHASAGEKLGGSLGAAISKWLGFGDYRVVRNTILTNSAGSIPAMHRTGQSVRIRHKEYLGPITGSIAFNVGAAYPINPGMSATFPWLSDIARSFQEYEIKGMIYHYIPTSGSAVSSTSSALGSVMIQTTYRATDSAPKSKVEMMNEYCANEVVPFDTMIHPIECDPKENPFAVHYTRAGPIPTGDLLLYDIGTTYVATQGMQSAYVVGDLWVTYDIELRKPIVSSNVTAAAGYFAATWNSPSVATTFPTNVATQLGNLPLTFAGRTITVPRGTFGTLIIWVHIHSSGGLSSSTGVEWIGAPTLTNCVPSDDLDSLNSEVRTDSNATQSNDLYFGLAVDKTDPSSVATILLPAPTWTSGLTTYSAVSISLIEDN